jgi:sialidase-1
MPPACQSLAARARCTRLDAYLSAEEVIIYSQDRYHVHVPNVVQLKSGDILVAFREGMEHISDDGRLVLVRSRDRGKTWGERQVLIDRPRLDDREATLTQLQDGTLLASVWANPYYDGSGRYSYSEFVRMRPAKVDVLRSDDNGNTWKPWSTIDPAPFVYVYTSRPLIEMPGGRLLLPLHVADDRFREGSALFSSDDKGKTWRLLAQIALARGEEDVEKNYHHLVGNLSAPSITLTASGKLLAIMRMAGGYHRLAVSEDAGKTWSEPHDLGLESGGYPASLITLRSGDILCIYGHRQRVNFLASRMIGGEFNIRPEEIEFLNLDAPSAIRIALQPR